MGITIGTGLALGAGAMIGASRFRNRQMRTSIGDRLQRTITGSTPAEREEAERQRQEAERLRLAEERAEEVRRVERREDTAIQRQVADMKKAGLSPGRATVPFGAGAGGVPAISTANMLEEITAGDDDLMRQVLIMAMLLRGAR